MRLSWAMFREPSSSLPHSSLLPSLTILHPDHTVNLPSFSSSPSRALHPPGSLPLSSRHTEQLPHSPRAQPLIGTFSMGALSCIGMSLTVNNAVSPINLTITSTCAVSSQHMPCMAFRACFTIVMAAFCMQSLAGILVNSRQKQERIGRHCPQLGSGSGIGSSSGFGGRLLFSQSTAASMFWLQMAFSASRALDFGKPMAVSAGRRSRYVCDSLSSCSWSESSALLSFKIVVEELRTAPASGPGYAGSRQ